MTCGSTVAPVVDRRLRAAAGGVESVDARSPREVVRRIDRLINPMYMREGSSSLVGGIRLFSAERLLS